MIGTANNDGFLSLEERFVALGGSPKLVDAATSGRKMNDAPRQATAVVAAARKLSAGQTAYVTFELGTNDLCDDPKTDPASFDSDLRSAIAILRAGLPPGSRILMMPVPDFNHLRDITQADPTARAFLALPRHSTACAPYLGDNSPSTLAEADTYLRQYDASLGKVCEEIEATERGQREALLHGRRVAAFAERLHDRRPEHGRLLASLTDRAGKDGRGGLGNRCLACRAAGSPAGGLRPSRSEPRRHPAARALRPRPAIDPAKVNPPAPQPPRLDTGWTCGPLELGGRAPERLGLRCRSDGVGLPGSLFEERQRTFDISGGDPMTSQLRGLDTRLHGLEPIGQVRVELSASPGQQASIGGVEEELVAEPPSIRRCAGLLSADYDAGLGQLTEILALIGAALHRTEAAPRMSCR